MMKRLYSFCLILVLLMAVSVSESHAQGLSAEDIADIKSVSAVAMSPDGEYIAYTLTVPRGDDDPRGGSFSELYLYPVDGDEPLSVIKKPNSARSPEWGPAGRLYFISYLPEHHRQTQVYSVNREGRDLMRHSRSETGISSFKWSPDGTHLAYRALDPVPSELQRRREQGYDMIVSGENERYMRLWVRERGQNAQPVTSDDIYIWDFSWSSGNDQLSIRYSDKPGADQDMLYTRIAVINRDGSEKQHLMSSDKKKDMMSWSPDGSKLAILAGKVYSDPLPQRLWIVETDGSSKTDITPGDWEGTPEWIGWQDNETLLFNAVERSSTTLNRLPAEGGEITRIAGGGPEIFRSISPDAGLNRFAASVNSSDQPGELYISTFESGEFQRLTHHNDWLSERGLGEQTSVTWSGADDKEIEGILVKPTAYQEGQRYPLVVLPHGGPEGISMNGWNTRVLYPVQLLANEGYMVFKPNYRGSGGRGTAFASANHRDLGGKEFEDVLLGIDYLAEEGYIDPEKVGMSGTSYGGYFSAWAATRHGDRFAAAITFAGLSNWISFMGTTDIPHEMSVVHWDLYWFDNEGQNWDRSPVAWLRDADTPLLVAHGLADERVHPEQSIQLHQFLKMKGIPTGLILYPRQPHGLTERAHQIDFMNRVVHWFDEYLN